MHEFKIIDEKRYPLNIVKMDTTDVLDYYRWEHRVTVGYRGRRFIVMIDNLKHEVYVEEIAVQLHVIEDRLRQAIIHWANANGFLNVLIPLYKADVKLE
jgi:hypothetical protein